MTIKAILQPNPLKEFGRELLQMTYEELCSKRDELLHQLENLRKNPCDNAKAIGHIVQQIRMIDAELSKRDVEPKDNGRAHEWSGLPPS